MNGIYDPVDDNVDPVWIAGTDIVAKLLVTTHSTILRQHYGRSWERDLAH